MAKFLNRLVVSPLADGYTWYLDTDFQYQSGKLATLQSITVPKGFETDFASIPSPLTMFLPKWSVYGPAAIVHDWLYWAQKTKRFEADSLLLEAMKVLNVNPIKRAIIYLGVRGFGWWAWWENKRLKARGVDRMRPFNAMWPALPNWHRTRISLGALFSGNRNRVGPFSRKS